MEIPQTKVWKSIENRSWWEPIASYEDKLDKSQNNPLNEQLNNFLGVIEKKEDPICSGIDGLNTLAVIEAIKLASKTRKVVKTETFMK